MKGKYSRGTVTITGADDSVTAADLIRTSEVFPAVEWGILFSQSQQGSARFPSQAWLESELPKLSGIPLCAHLCGRWVRDLVLEGRFTWDEAFQDLGQYFDRVQINFHGQFHRAVPAFTEVAYADRRQFILQCDGVNDATVRSLADGSDGRVVPLFDTSGGAGVLPTAWPSAWPGVYCGYAGGLGPDSITEQLPRIAEAAGSDAYWIDMERRVRTEDDQALDLGKVNSVLQQIENVLCQEGAL